MAAVGAVTRDAIEGYCVLGELALDGSITTVAGALPPRCHEETSFFEAENLPEVPDPLR